MATWVDTPAVLEAATAPVAADLRKCVEKVPRLIGIHATRAKDGSTTVAMPLYGVGTRGPTAGEKCLVAAIAKIQLPPLPDGVDRMIFGHTISDEAVAVDFGEWKDPKATIDKLVADRRGKLAACVTQSRTVRLVLDLAKGKTRIWLPAWQFHSPSGDGSTPKHEQIVKTCLTRAIAKWEAPALPRAMAELEITIPMTVHE